jgi:class 3 adenylate cyclase
VAVAVIRDNLRPRMPDNIDGSLCPSEYEELVTNCWHQDPTIRPTFLEIMTRLSTLIGDSSMSTGYSRSSSSSSSAASLTNTTNSVVKSPRGVEKKPKNGARMSTGSWTLPTSSQSGSSTSGSGSATGGSRNLSFAGIGGGTGGPAVRAPDGEVTLVFSDITRAASLWEANAAAMRDATLLHNDALRAALKRHRGYEAMLSSAGATPTWTSGEGSFCMAFHCVDDALDWCADVQAALLTLDWPAALLEHAGAAEAWADVDDTKVVWRGLRVRMGVHVSTTQGGGMLRMGKEAMTRRAEYSGPAVAAAARMTAMAHGGQVIVSRAVVEKMRQSAATLDNADTTQAHHHNYTVASLGKFHLPDAPDGTHSRGVSCCVCVCVCVCVCGCCVSCVCVCRACGARRSCRAVVADLVGCRLEIV